MAVKALITIFDDETGRTYLDKHLMEPTSSSPMGSNMFETWRYDFYFHFNIIEDELLPKPTVLDDYDCTACAHDGDSNICSECEDGSRYHKLGVEV